mgnify:CR=1 FL=1
MTYPSFYDPQKVGTLYTPNASHIIDEAHSTNILSADADTTKTALLLIDAQVDFIHEDGALSVPNAIVDTQRTIEWIFRNLEGITKIYASLDSHIPNQIFSSSWWVDAEGKSQDKKMSARVFLHTQKEYEPHLFRVGRVFSVKGDDDSE